MEEGNEELTDRIGREAFEVTQNAKTEPPFSGKYYKNESTGEYTCIVCGNTLFKSGAKFNSHSGWPSFYEPAYKNSVVLEVDNSLGTKRTEVSCAKCNAHLGHVFDDAHDQPTNKRYCINSVSLGFDGKMNEDEDEGE